MTTPFFVCPICCFNGLKEQPYNEHGSPSYEICPCCGFEFGHDEKEKTALFREDWIKKGMPWFEPGLKPADWDPGEHLKRLP